MPDVLVRVTPQVGARMQGGPVQDGDGAVVAAERQQPPIRAERQALHHAQAR